MSNEVILNLSFNNQTVTDLTGNWTLDGTPNATYEQIDGRDGYSIVEGSLGRCIVLNAVDQNARYDEYTVDFDMFVKSTYTSDYYNYNVFYLWSQKNPKIQGSFDGKIGEVLSISPRIGGSSPRAVTSYSPIGRWVHVTITSGPTDENNLYHTAVYVDGVKLTERTDSMGISGGNPFGISQRIIPCARDPGSFLMPNGPGVCLNTYKIVAGIHAPNQKPAISLLNLSRVFNNFCTWLKGQLSTVALTGSYNDLSDKPTISTVNDGTLTIQQNGTNVQTFTANASTNKTANIQCVDLSTAQTISGVKTFNDIPIVVNGKTYVSKINASRADGTQAGFSAYNGFKVVCNNDSQGWDNTAFAIHIPEYSPTSASVGFKLYDCIEGSSSYKGFGFRKNNNDFYLFPTATNVINLGSSASQWNNTYTRNILIDNDINIASSLINKTSNSGVLTVRGGINDSEGASLSLYGKDYGGSPGLIGNIYMTAYGSSDYTNFRIYPNGIIRVYNNSTATTKNVAMQEDVVNLTTAQTIGGVKTFTSNMVIQGSKKVTCNLDNSFIELDGGTTWGKGGSIVLSGQDRSTYTGSVLIVSKTDTNTDILQYQNGELKPLSNNTNNSSLGTSTNKWSKVYSDDIVHTTGNETIGGTKTFMSLLSKSSNLERGAVPTTNINEDPIFISADKNNRRTLAFFNYYNTNGNGRVILYAYNQNTTNFDNIGLVFNFDNINSSKSIYPVITNNFDFGTSTNKWKSFNGINPGALSLPGTSVNVDTTNWVLDGTPNHFVPTSDGWLGIQAIDTVYDQMHYVFIGRTGGGNTYYQQNLTVTVNALWDSKYHGCAFIPVVKGFNYDIRCICSTIVATFYPCQGNV